jgi:hypothetical protein
MKSFGVAITLFAVLAQGTLTSAALFNIENDLDPCMEVVISDEDQCNGDTVTYCLQPNTNFTGSCPLSYDQTTVYVDGEAVNLSTASPLPAALCPDGSPGQCMFSTLTGAMNENSCSALDSFDSFDTATENVGLTCANTQNGPCVTVPLVYTLASEYFGEHAEVIFAVKDQDGCDPATESGGWTCSDDSFGDTCACNGVRTSVAIFDGIKNCTFCGNGIKEGDEDCDGPDALGGCTPECKRPICGNFITEVTEDCDPPGNGCSNVCEKTRDGGTNGDPHFKTWAGGRYDFHGGCDLILFSSSQFKQGWGVDVHIRTTMRRDMSYISSAALRIGTDVLEVASQGIYYLNGVLGADMPNTLSGFHIAHSQPNVYMHTFSVDLGIGESIKLKTYKDFVSVKVTGAQSTDFGDSVGLMGAFGEDDLRLARDGTTVLGDHNAFGLEWQVLDTEPKLFQNERLPQHPMECVMPSTAQTATQSRRLSETSTADELAAEKACAQWGAGKDDCVFDVLTTGDLEMAMMGAY